MASTRERAKQLSEALSRTAESLEKSSVLAREHADRGEAAGRRHEAAAERRVAEHAHEAAKLARSRSAEASDWGQHDQRDRTVNARV